MTFKSSNITLTSCVSKELFLKLTFSVLVTPTRVAGNVYRLWGAYTPLFWVSVEDLNELKKQRNMPYEMFEK